MLLHAPVGLPSQVRRKAVYHYLHKEHGIMDNSLESRRKDTLTWANDCSDRVRLMLRHLRFLKLSRSTFMTPGLQKLIDMADVKGTPPPEAAPPTEPPPTEPAPPTQPAPVLVGSTASPLKRRRLIRKESSLGSSVELCSVKGHRPCGKASDARTVDFGMESDTSAEASHNPAPVLAQTAKVEEGPRNEEAYRAECQYRSEKHRAAGILHSM